MTVLVDGALWRWRGRRWAHLVSDRSHDELHEFARRLGKRRLGFQGDHYDVDVLDRDRALAMGAEAVDSRSLVRRLRDAGLRDRASKPGWVELARWPPGRAVDGFSGSVAPFGAAGARLGDALRSYVGLSRPAAVGVFADGSHVALLLDLPAGLDPPCLAPDVDLHVVGGRRADGECSIELFVRR